MLVRSEVSTDGAILVQTLGVDVAMLVRSEVSTDGAMLVQRLVYM